MLFELYLVGAGVLCGVFGVSCSFFADMGGLDSRWIHFNGAEGLFFFCPQLLNVVWECNGTECSSQTFWLDLCFFF